MANQLARLIAARCEVGPEDDVVDALLEHLEQVLAGDAVLVRRQLVEVAELLLEHAVDAAGLLLLAQLHEVLAVTDAAPTVLARRVRLALHRALHRFALRALEEQLHPLAAAEPADPFGVPSHRSDPPPLRLAATVVRDRRDVLDADDLDARVLDRADRRLATRAGALAPSRRPCGRRAPSPGAPRSRPRAARRTACSCASP